MLNHFGKQSATPRWQHASPKTRLVNAEIPAVCGHRHDLHEASQGAHASKGLQAVAAGGAAIRRDSIPHREKLAGLARRHDLQLSAGARPGRKSWKQPTMLRMPKKRKGWCAQGRSLR